MRLGFKTPHACDLDLLLAQLNSQITGLSSREAEARLITYGRNQLPIKRPVPAFKVFLRQFLSPLIYILLFAGVISLFMGHKTDAGFILFVLIVNALLGAFQEYKAERGAEALRQIVKTQSIVERDGESIELSSELIVPGDIVWLESGAKVPADIRLISAHGLQVDESLLTGESLPVTKEIGLSIEQGAPLGDRKNMAFAGTLIARGRAKGLVVSTGMNTELGRIAETVLKASSTKTPLILRMEKFTWALAVILLFAVAIMGVVLIARGESLGSVFMLAVALGVAAIPEGLPVALTLALSIASRKMAKRQVIVRNLSSVEALGSCTYIATDKTGTLTVNELTVQVVAHPELGYIPLTGVGAVPEGDFEIPEFVSKYTANEFIANLCRIAVLCNEGTLSRKSANWVTHGDAVDVAMLVMAHKAGVTAGSLLSDFELVAEIPYEPQHRYSASLHAKDGFQVITAKGAIEAILPMCNQMFSATGDCPLDRVEIEKQAVELAQQGYRVLALAHKYLDFKKLYSLEGSDLSDLTFVGLVGMMDPLRPDAKAAVLDCQTAGIKVAMVTGDHPMTALAIAKELGLADSADDIVTGKMLDEAEVGHLDNLVRRGRVFARVEPQQKYKIIEVLIRQNEFVAVTGDGANDAPALKIAHVGVAMGKGGTDVARETADLIITDDRFSSLVAGVQEGRVAYSNVRKVIYLLVATCVAEIILFLLSVLANLPMPLTAVQLLWLNLVTDGIQVLALAFESEEGDELLQSPRPPEEPIFNSIMLERVILSAGSMGALAFWTYFDLLSQGVNGVAVQSYLLLLMVLFENIMIGNAKSETKSVFVLNPLRNPFLLIATVAALGVHVLAMYVPLLREVLGVSPVSVATWSRCIGTALAVFLIIEIHKLLRRQWPNKGRHAFDRLGRGKVKP